MIRHQIIRRHGVTARLFVGNLILVITDTCPADFADCAIRCLDKRRPQYRPQESDFEPRPYIPKYSKFIGQLGGQSR